MNHSLCCAYDSGNPPSLLARSISPPALRLPPPSSRSTAPASPPTVGLSNTSLNPISTPSASRTRDTTCVANNECPPISKKFASLPTSFTLSTSLHIPPTISSIGLSSSPSSFPPSPLSTPGNLFRSTFPFAVNGISFTFTIAHGTMYSGSFAPIFLLNSSSLTSSPSSTTTYPTSRFSPPSYSFTTTALWLTPASSLSATSISPNSIRYPLIFTC